MNASWGAYNQRLTQQTKEALEQLGIPYNSNITETEGKMLLKAHKNEQSKNDNNNSFQQGSNSSDFLFKKAIKLAQELGIQVNENVNFSQLLSQIETELKNRLNISKDNIDELKKLKNLSQELAFIQAQSNGSSGYDNTNQALMASLEMLGEYNKNFLHKQN